MRENKSDTHELMPKQERYIAALIAGNSTVTSAKIAGVSEATVHVWMKQPHVQRAYQEAKQTVFDSALEKLSDDIDAAIRGIKLIALDKEVPPQVRLRGYQIWLETALGIATVKRLEERTTALEDMLRDKSA